MGWSSGGRRVSDPRSHALRGNARGDALRPEPPNELERSCTRQHQDAERPQVRNDAERRYEVLTPDPGTMAKYQHAPERGWSEKFADAFRGVKVGLRGQVSFCVHLFFTVAVILAGTVLKMELLEWCLLALCITTVLAAEMFNTALESMARAITDDVRPELGNALDIGSAGVLLSALGAVVVGSIIFLHRLAVLLLAWQ
jgi:diacylglycerol kinase